MGKRKYTHVDEYEPVILQMREEGRTRREIAEHLGLTMKQIKGWINRYNRRQRRSFAPEASITKYFRLSKRLLTAYAIPFVAFPAIPFEVSLVVPGSLNALIKE